MIEERQQQLDSLYATTFGGDSKTSKPTSDIVLDRNAQPPEAKLKKLLQNDIARMTYEHNRDDLPSLSEYDLSLANYAAREGWLDQEIADLIISFRRRYGDEKAIKKALRLDYISGVIGKARHSGMLELLPFEVEKLIQYGTEDAEYTLVIKGGEPIDMGETSALLSARRARNRLWERGYTLSPTAIKRWTQITDALRALVEIQPTVTTLEETEQWLRNHLSTRYTEVLMIDPDDRKQPDSLSKALTVGYGASIIRDKQGRIYLSINSVISHARFHLGQSLTGKALAARLRKMGFERASVASDYSGSKRSQVRMWKSPVGFLPPREDETHGEARLVPSDMVDQIGQAIAEEEWSPLDRATRKINKEG